MKQMSLIEKAIIVILVIVIAIVIIYSVFMLRGPVSVNCRRACADVDGRAWTDCIKMCDDKTQ